MPDTAATLTVSALDIPSRVQSLPAPVRSLAAPIEASVGTFVDDQALQVAQSSQFPELWVDLNRTAHQGLLQLVRGETPADGAVTGTNGDAQVNLLVLVPALLERVEQDAPDLLVSQLASGITDGSSNPCQLRQVLVQAAGRQLPADFGYVSLTQASTLATARQAVQVLDRMTWALVLGGLAAVAITLVVSLERRVTTLRLGVGVALGMFLADLTLLVAKDRLVSSLAGHPISGAAEGALGAALSSLAQLMLIVFVVAVAAALLAYLAGRRERMTVLPH